MPTYECETFRVSFAHADAAYSVTAIAANGAETTAPFELPMSSDELETIVVDLGVAREVAPDDADVLQHDAEQLGTALFAALFDGPVGESYLEAQRDAATRNRGVRLTLSLAETPELLDVPWELMYRRPKFIASQRHTPVVRFLDVGDLPPPFDIEGPVRILGVVASPDGLPPLAVDDERRRVEAALAVMVERGLVELEWCDPASKESLFDCLANGTFHIVHFIGHSDFTEDGDGTVYLVGADGQPERVTESLLSMLLGDQTSLRLVVLNSCKGARTTLIDPFGGIATTLVAMGVPAVVAMQFSISDEAAIVFAEELFTSLIGRQYPVDAAVAEARKAVFMKVSEVEWATPVLFLRTDDGLLFNFTAEPSQMPLVKPPEPIVVDAAPPTPRTTPPRALTTRP
jgi:CHAT domain